MVNRALHDNDDEDDAINQVVLAMTEYNYTQFKDLSAFERKSIEKALLRYCELDTLAMVMLVRGLMEYSWNSTQDSLRGFGESQLRKTL